MLANVKTFREIDQSVMMMIYWAPAHDLSAGETMWEWPLRPASQNI